MLDTNGNCQCRLCLCLSDPSGTDLSLVFSSPPSPPSSWPVSDYYYKCLIYHIQASGSPQPIHFLKAHDISSPFFYFLTFEKADCSIFTLLVGWLVGRSVGRSTSPLIFFIGPRSDHSLLRSVTHSLTHSLTH